MTDRRPHSRTYSALIATSNDWHGGAGNDRQSLRHSGFPITEAGITTRIHRVSWSRYHRSMSVGPGITARCPSVPVSMLGVRRVSVSRLDFRRVPVSLLDIRRIASSRLGVRRSRYHRSVSVGSRYHCSVSVGSRYHCSVSVGSRYHCSVSVGSRYRRSGLDNIQGVSERMIFLNHQ